MGAGAGQADEGRQEVGPKPHLWKQKPLPLAHPSLLSPPYSLPSRAYLVGRKVGVGGVQQRLESGAVGPSRHDDLPGGRGEEGGRGVRGEE